MICSNVHLYGRSDKKNRQNVIAKPSEPNINWTT